MSKHVVFLYLKIFIMLFKVLKEGVKKEVVPMEAVKIEAVESEAAEETDISVD